MKISVVIPAYNAARWIAGTLDCLSCQSQRPATIIVVDDGSTDETVEIVRSWASDARLICKRNEGASIARNIGLADVSSPYVFFLDADDYVEGDFIAGAATALDRDGADIAFSPVISEGPDGSRVRTFHYESIPEPLDVFKRWLDHYSQPPCSIVWRTDFIRRIGGWNKEVTLNDDGELMMRAMLYAPVLANFSDGHGVYRAHQFSSLSKTRSVDALEREFRAMLGLMELAMQKGLVTDFNGFGRKIYIIARGLFEIGCRDLGREALSVSRNVGLRSHPGTRAHRLLAGLAGLEVKTDLVRHLRRYIK